MKYHNCSIFILSILALFCINRIEAQNSPTNTKTYPTQSQIDSVLKKRFDNYKIVELIRTDKNDSTFINELRFIEAPSSMSTKKLLFDVLGKWDQEVRLNGETHPILIWKNKKLLKTNNEYFSIAANGIESYEEMYSSVMIFDSLNNDCFDKNYNNRKKLINYFVKGLKNQSKDKKFYDVYWKMIKDYKKKTNNTKPDYSLTLLNDKVIKGDFKIRNSYFLDKSSGNKILYDSIRSYIYYGYNKPYTYYMIHAKKYKDVTKVSRAAGYKVYHGKKVDLFHGIFHNGLTPKRSIKYYNPDFETYAKKKGDLYSYSIRCMDGLGCVDVKKRLFDFFEGCPELIKKIKNNEINELDTIRIVEFYENECGN